MNKMRDSAHALFNSKTIKRFCSNVTITPEQRKAANEWLELLEREGLEEEKKNYLRFAEIVLDKLLGYPQRKINFESDNVEFQISDPTGRNVVCFEVKGTSVKDLFAPQHRGKKEHETPIKQTWDYMGKNNLDYGICTNYKEFVLIDRNKGYSKYHIFDFTEIKNNHEKLRELIAIFSKESVIDKQFVETLYDASVIEEREFTKQFYKLFHETRLMLIKEFQSNGVSKEEAIHYGQVFLNRLIFIFFLEDTDKLPHRLFTERILKVIDAMPMTEHSKYVSETILGLFESLDKGAQMPDYIFGFDGGFFHYKIPPTIYFKDLREPNFFKDVYQYSELKKVKLDEFSEKVVKKYSGKLNSIISNLLAMDSFDFVSELNVNILGHIFEQSLTDLEELKGEQDSKRKKEGIFYTPEYVTDYICRNTIIQYLSKQGATDAHELIQEYADNIEELEKRFREIKILDPACGSGAFLIKAVDVLLEVYKEIQMFKEYRGQYSLFTKRRKSKELAEQMTLVKWNEESEARKIIENNIFGVDINEESVEITQLSMFLKMATANRKLMDLSKNIRVGNSIISDREIAGNKAFDWKSAFPDIVGKQGFSVVIGNPPYGAELSKIEQKHLMEKFSIGSTDTAQLMMELAYRRLAEDGINGFIVPKALTFASNWKKIRSMLTKDLVILIDVGKVWNEVKLEQAIYVVRKNANTDSYRSGTRSRQRLEANLKIDKKDCDLFGFLINGITKDELLLGKKIYSNAEKLEKYAENQRGGMLQGAVKETGDIRVLGGQHIQRYYLSGSKGYVNKKDIDDDKAFVAKDAVLAQNIVAHIENPVDHIKIIATVPTTTDFIILDTVNQLKTKNGVSTYFLAGLLNSKIVNWYCYRFIFAKAIRTMHFDKPVTDRIPIVVKNQGPIEKEVKELIRNNELYADIKIKFLNNLVGTFKIEKPNSKLEEFQKLDFNKLIAEAEKLGKTRISLKEKDEWSDYFNEQKKKILELESKIKENESRIDRIFYDLFGLNQHEIDLVEKYMAE